MIYKVVMESFNQFLEILSGHIWGYMLILVASTGVFFTIALKGIQFRGFKHAVKAVMGTYDSPGAPGQISHFQALCAALSATIGLGNISGVAIAIKMGGPGACFWMLVAGFFGMSIKFAECSLSTTFRKIDKDGNVHGGPMYYIPKILGKKSAPLAYFYAISCSLATLGAASLFQTNQAAAILEGSFRIPPYLTGFVFTILVVMVILGGIKRIGEVASKIVPFMAVSYVFGGLTVIFANYELVPQVVYTIFHDAFNGTAMVGGGAGIALRTAIIQGFRRGVFSNEAGLGTASIVHAAASTKEPLREGMVALLEPFIDTVVICSITALVILVSGAWITHPDLSGVNLTAEALNSGIQGFGTYFIPIAVCLFCYSTLISWYYYGETSVGFLFKERSFLRKKAILLFKLIFCTCVFIGPLWKLMPIINFTDFLIALMIIPNSIALWFYLPKLRKKADEYLSRHC